MMDTYNEEEEVQGSLPFDDDFYDAVDASIYRCVTEVVGPMEQRLTDRLVAECAKLAHVAAPGPSSEVDPPPPKRPHTQEGQEGAHGVDKDAFERLRAAFLAKEPLCPPVQPQSVVPVASLPPSSPATGGRGGVVETGLGFGCSAPGQRRHAGSG